MRSLRSIVVFYRLDLRCRLFCRFGLLRGKIAVDARENFAHGMLGRFVIRKFRGHVDESNIHRRSVFPCVFAVKAVSFSHQATHSYTVHRVSQTSFRNTYHELSYLWTTVAILTHAPNSPPWIGHDGASGVSRHKQPLYCREAAEFLSLVKSQRFHLNRGVNVG